MEAGKDIQKFLEWRVDYIIHWRVGSPLNILGSIVETLGNRNLKDQIAPGI